MSFREQLHRLRQLLTVELIVAIYVVTHFNRIIIEYNSRDFFTFGYAIEHSGDDTSYHVLLQYFIIPGIILLFVGSYSDKHCLRKPFLLLPLFGEFISFTGYFLCIKNEKKCATCVYSILRIIPACFGGLPMIWMASCAYLADITNFQTRTFRMGVLDIMPFAVDFVVNYCGIVGFNTLTHWILMNGGLLLAVILYGIFWIEEPRQPEIKSLRLFLDIVNPEHVLKNIKMLLAKRPHKGRSVIYILFCLVFVYNFIFNSNGYLIEQKFFQMGESNRHDVFKTNISLILLVGEVALVILLTKLLQVDDLVILLVNLLFQVVSNIIFGLAKSEVTLYVAQVVGTGSTLIPTVSKSMMTKTVSKEDYGKISVCFSLFYGLAFALIDKYKYINQMVNHSGYFYFAAYVHVVFVFIILWIYIKKDKLEEDVRDYCLMDEETGVTDGI